MASEPASFLARWFLSEVRGMVPQWFAVLFLGVPRTEVLRLTAEAKGLQRTKVGLVGSLDLYGDATASAGTVRDLPRAVIAELPPELCLARRIEAPARSTAQLAAVAAMDLARKTPFRSGDVYTALSSPQKVAGGLMATQWVARREDIARLERNLKAVGIVLAGVRVRGQETVPPLLADLGATGRTAGRHWRKTNGILTACALVAALIGWAYPAWREKQAYPMLAERFSAAEERALAIRSEIENLRLIAGEQSAFLGQLVQGPRLSSSLRELTVALPDDTWISDLTYADDALVISGETSASAADLVISLANSRAFANPRLSGPVSRSTTGGERFEIALDLRGGQ